ncbi:DMT family transporter [Propylenella binzhouense]|uniref:DMT family transporter n=1 Tax=Propylenella binzhouense TaxID=2555902 RepID=A0A964T3M8_9HYPH|nr:DMT family transporter [Propylenella binzhouense]MYZ47775.1 DMT family transporter [Propylenella binzhouense]
MNPAFGILLKVASTVLFTLMLVAIKATEGRVPEGEVVFFRSFFGLIPIVAMLAWQGLFPAALRTPRPLVHFSRGLVGVTAMGLGFAAVQRLPLPEAMAIAYAAPLFLVALGALVLHEPVRLYRWSAVLVGFLGIMIILWPQFELLRSGRLGSAALAGAAFGIVAAFLSAMAGIFVRSMTHSEGTGTIVFYFSVTSSVAGLLTIPFGWVAPSAFDAALLVSAGLFGGVGQILMTSAYRNADASTIAPFEYASMIWGVALGYLVFAELPGPSLLFGGPVVVASGVFIILRERQLGLKRARQRRATPPHG